MNVIYCPPYSKSQIFHPQPRKPVIFLLRNYFTLSINLKKSHEYGKCDPKKYFGNEISSLPNISCPQSISNMGVEEPAFCMIL